MDMESMRKLMGLQEPDSCDHEWITAIPRHGHGVQRCLKCATTKLLTAEETEKLFNS